MTDTEARRLAEQCVAEQYDAWPGPGEQQAQRRQLARHFLALLERTRLTKSESAHVQAMKYEIADDGDDDNPPADSIDRDDANELLAIIDRITQPEAGGGLQTTAPFTTDMQCAFDASAPIPNSGGGG